MDQTHLRHRVPFVIMRISTGIVFLLFGIGKFQNDIWAETMRSMSVFKALPPSAGFWIIAVGILELAVAAGLILGIFTRWAAGIAALQLIAILILLRFQQTRDFGLLGAALYMMFAGHDFAGLGMLVRRNRKEIGSP